MSAADSLNPKQFHPHLNHYRDGGVGGVGEDHSVVGYVPTRTLAAMPGNSVDPVRVQHYQEKLRSGQGFKDPVMVVYDPKNNQAFVGEGNHRVAAAAAEGISHVPARVVRSYPFNPVDTEQGRNAQKTPDAKSAWKGGMGEEYWPSDMHPKHLFRNVL